MADGLLALGHEVHFLHLQQPLWASDAAMRRFWQQRLHVFRGLSLASGLGRARRKLLRVAAKTLHLNLPVDSYFDPAAARCLGARFDRHGYDAIIVSYVFYSRLLESVPDGVLKLIDTHDVFSDRYRMYRTHGQAGEFFSTSREEEGRALGRADTVLAIQEQDARHFREVAGTPVVVVGHLAPPIAGGTVPRRSLPGARGMLFVGGPMGINLHGISWFIERVLPLVRQAVRDAELWLVGGISDRVAQTPGVRRFGFVDPMDELYAQAAVVINPQQFGTGLSIKSVDALRYGRPLVATAAGARGLEAGAERAFLQADSPDEFAERLIRLLLQPTEAQALAQRAGAFAEEYYRQNLQALADVMLARPPVTAVGRR
jgi:glycosyltransferase involved in cell wall biosynthesis